MKPSVLVLAAGIGSRYGGLKQIDPVGPGGEAIIDYSVYDALRAGFGKLVFVIRRDIEAAFREAIGRRFEAKAAVEYVFQELDALPPGFSPPPGRNKPWGTGHAILMAADLIREPFAAINADDFYGPESYRLLHDFLRDSADARIPTFAIVGFRLANTLSEAGSVSRGVCYCDADGYLERLDELTHIEKDGDAIRYTDDSGQIHTLTGEETASMNLWGFTSDIFEQFRRDFTAFLQDRGSQEKAEYYLSLGVNALVAAGRARVRILSTPETWCGVTYQDDKPHVTRHIRGLIERGIYPAKLWS